MWASYIKDLEQHIEDKALDINHVFVILRSLYAVNMLDESLSIGLIQYLMKKGYTATDLLRLSSSDKPFNRAVHLIGIISQSAPSIKNKQFIM
jgi:hypothetical protein